MWPMSLLFNGGIEFFVGSLQWPINFTRLFFVNIHEYIDVTLSMLCANNLFLLIYLVTFFLKSTKGFNNVNYSLFLKFQLTRRKWQLRHLSHLLLVNTTFWKEYQLIISKYWDTTFLRLRLTQIWFYRDLYYLCCCSCCILIAN